MLVGDDKPRDISSSVFLKQLVLIPLFCLAVGNLTADAAIQITGWNFAGYAAAALFGTASGYLLQLHDGRMVESLGRWIWIPPVCVLLLVIAWDHSDGFPVSHYFYAGGPSLADLGFWLFTLPAISCCFYSVGLTLGYRRQQRARASPSRLS